MDTGVAAGALITIGVSIPYTLRYISAIYRDGKKYIYVAARKICLALPGCCSLSRHAKIVRLCT